MGTSCSFYATYVLPRLIDLAMRSPAATAERRRLIPLASGTVLEVGVGSGLNIPFYGVGVSRLYALDPSRPLWRLARKQLTSAGFPIEFMAASAEHIPLGDMAVDSVVMTWTLCSIPDPVTALAEMRRVLRLGGRLIFVEHGRSPDEGVCTWQERLNPLWRRVTGGCNLDRRIDDLIRSARFDVLQMERAYGGGPKPMAYLYKGIAARSEP